MAYNLEEFTERHVDTPLTNFPLKEDIFDRMSDITTALLPLINDYNRYMNENDLLEANQLLASNPNLLNCFFNTEKYNRLRDAVIALERHRLDKKHMEMLVGNKTSVGDDTITFLAYKKPSADFTVVIEGG